MTQKMRLRSGEILAHALKKKASIMYLLLPEASATRL